MADELPAPINNTGRAIFMAATLVFCGSLIVWVILFGKAENGLHQTALSWSFTLMAVVLAAIGVGSVLPFVPALLDRK